jgi:hypothetical protein
VCSSWSFESNTVEGWAFGLGNLDPSPTAAVTTTHPAAGSFSLFVPVSTIAWVQVPFCAGIGANMAGKSFHAQVFFDTGGAVFTNTGTDLNQVFFNLTTDPNGVNGGPAGAKTGLVQAYLDPSVANGFPLFLPNTWQSLNAPGPTDNPLVTTQAAMIQIGVQLSNPPATYTQGRLFVDDVRIF